MKPLPTSGLSAPVREDWLAMNVEAPLDPDAPAIDAHHHLWLRPDERYLVDEYAADLDSGHRIDATVYVDCRSMYRQDGPEAMRPVGEVEFANGCAAMAASGAFGPTRQCAAIVGHADLRAGAAVRPVLEALVAAGNGRFRGIRQVSAWDPDEAVMKPIATRPPGLLGDAAFRAGFAVLGELGLTFDAFLFHPQLDELAALADAFPEVTIILDHCGGPTGIGRHAADQTGVFAAWVARLREVARRPNVSVKLSGLGMRMPGFDFHTRPVPAGSAELAAAWGPYLEICLEAFGAERAMFASNFPPDKGSTSFVTLWNAFKRFAAPLGSDERDALLRGTAARLYRIDG